MEELPLPNVFRPENQWQTTTTNIQDRLDVLHSQQPFVDVRFRVENRRADGSGTDVQIFNAHKLILSASSPVFAQLFYGSRTDQGCAISEYKVMDITHKAFENMLIYVYKGDVQLKSPRDALQTYKAAKKYAVSHLLKKCKERFESVVLSAQDVIPILQDEAHNEIHSLHQNCLDVVEDKPLEVIRLAAETAKTDTLDMFLQMERLSVSSELALLRELVEGIRIRASNADSQSANQYIRKFLKNIRFLTMTPQEFAIALDICDAAISQTEGFAILRAVCHPGSKSFYLPQWCSKVTRNRISAARNVVELDILPPYPVFGDHVDSDQDSLISSLEIRVHGGRFVFTAVAINCRRISEDLDDILGRSGSPSARCTLNIRNNEAGIAFERVKQLQVDADTIVLPFPIPLPVSERQEAKVSVILENTFGLEFSRFVHSRFLAGNEDEGFEVKINNYRQNDNSFAVSKLYYT